MNKIELAICKKQQEAIPSSMNDFYDLIRQQASYSALVAWMQKRQTCSYQAACLRVNVEMQQYRLTHQLPQQDEQ